MSTTPDSLPAEITTLADAAPIQSLSRTLGRLFAEHTRFLVVTLEFFLLVLLAERYHLESQTFHRVLVLSLLGFVIHHLLPMKWKLPFFAALSIFATVAVVDAIGALSLSGPGPVLVALGLILLGMCHLPIPFAARVTLLLASGVGLAIVRANYQWFPTLEGIWPVLASMFMFRVMIYLYDLKYQSTQFSPARGLAYFFMVPNACFPLFPIVDYKTFNTTYYNDEPVRIYQTGIKWMFRGIVQLLLYRVVYQFGLLNIADVRDLGDVAEFMVATYLLYLKVSGQFHLIVGLLHMFGFNLPETHHLYLLASSFTDFWRRINIYWKDFIMKIFFYPAFFALRNLGTVRAIALGTVVAFFATWALHSWQWFWFVGKFLVTWQDISFWTILALLVLVNAVIEAVRGRKKTLTPPKFDSKARLIVALKTVATFVVICSLWTLWSCQSAGELQVLAESATKASLGNVLSILACLALIGTAGALWGSSAREDSAGNSPKTRPAPQPSLSTALVIIAASIAVLVFARAELAEGSWIHDARQDLIFDRLNSADKDRQRRGYYEELDVARLRQNQWDKQIQPRDWNPNGLLRPIPGFLRSELRPSESMVICGALATTNRWGMRDRDYEQRKPADTYRLVLSGSSHEAGWGVKDDETFEHLLEKRFNAVDDKSPPQFEILNMAVGGHSLLERLYRFEHDGLEFQPDAVLFALCAADRHFLREHLARLLHEARPMPNAYRTELFDGLDVDSHDPIPVLENQLDPYMPQTISWIFARLAKVCADRDIRSIVFYRPSPLIDEREASLRDELLALAREAGLGVIDLTPAFQSVPNRNTLVVAEWDDHSSPLGHRLLADELYRQLAPQLRLK